MYILSKLAMVRSTTASPVSVPLPAEVHSHARYRVDTG